MKWRMINSANCGIFGIHVWTKSMHSVGRIYHLKNVIALSLDPSEYTSKPIYPVLAYTVLVTRLKTFTAK